ncbi:MAG TPA: tetratricopeptide repeat protein [Planctomycetota bacterium]
MSNNQEIFDRAVAAEESGDLARASWLYRKCTQLNPTWDEAWILCAQALMHLKRFDESRDAAAHVSGTPKDRATAQQLIGRCYQDQEDWPRAETAFRESLALDVRVTTWVFLGLVISAQNRGDEAIAAYQQALTIEPDYEEAHYNLGCHYSLRREYEKAIAHFREAIKKDPDYALALAELGYALYCTGTQGDEARQLLERSVRLNPEYGWSRIYLANLLEAQSEIDAATVQYEAALKIWPDSALAHSHFGNMLAKHRRDLDRAKHLLKMGVKLEPDNPWHLFFLGYDLMFCWHRRRDGAKYLRKAAQLGHKKSQRLLERLASGSYTPKADRVECCLECGEPMKNRGSHWWCPGCGSDLRTPADGRKLK